VAECHIGRRVSDVEGGYGSVREDKGLPYGLLFGVFLFLFLLTLLFQALCSLFFLVLLCYETFRHGCIIMI